MQAAAASSSVRIDKGADEFHINNKDTCKVPKVCNRAAALMSDVKAGLSRLVINQSLTLILFYRVLQSPLRNIR